MSFPRGNINLSQALPGIDDPKSIREHMPKEMRMDKKSEAYSVINARSRKTLFPNTRGTYTVGASQQTINLPVITDAYLDLPTATLDFNLLVSGNGGDNNDACMENGWAWIREIRVLVGDRELERFRNHNQVLDVLKQGSMPRDYADNQYRWAGDWIDEDPHVASQAITFTDSGADTVAVNVYPNLQSKFATAVSAQNNSGNGINLSFPLYHLGFFRQKMYFPNRNIPVVLQIIMENQKGTFLVQDASGDNSTLPTVQISELKLNVMGVYPNPQYVQAVSEMIAGGNSSPMVFPIETYLTQGVSVSQATTLTSKQWVYNLGLRFLKTLWVIGRKQDQISNAKYLKNSYPSFTPEDVSLFVNGKRYPELPYANSAEAYQGLLESFNNKADISAPNSISRQEYEANNDKQIPASATAVDFYKDKGILGWDLEQYHGAYGSMTGLNTQSLGYALRVDGKFKAPSASEYEMLGIFHFLKLMKVSGNVVEIVEP